ncbi:glycoside hydrolase family 117 protein [Bacteroidota bacterium]
MNRLVFLIIIVVVSGFSSCQNGGDESAAIKRYRIQGLLYEEDNEFYTEFRNTPITGLGLEEGVSRRDPSGVIKVDDTYYVWYTRAEGPPVVGQDHANDTLRAYHYDLADIGYATSLDGYNWTEQGVSAIRGPKGSFDHRTIFTPDILVANGKYYLFYQAAGELSQGLGWDFGFNLIGMSWADSPDGPWHRHPEPILNLGPEGSFDELNMHDPSFIVKGGKYYLYYKGQPKGPKLASYLEGRDAKYGTRLAWGVAIADNPEGPYIKSKYNPVICAGHEIIVFPYRHGICALLNQGPEKGSLQFSEDGINFYPKAYGLVNIPHAAGYYRAGNFADIETVTGQGITWGFRNRMGNIDGHLWNFLSRWDCDLNLQRGDSLRKENEDRLQTYHNE